MPQKVKLAVVLAATEADAKALALTVSGHPAFEVRPMCSVAVMAVAQVGAHSPSVVLVPNLWKTGSVVADDEGTQLRNAIFIVTGLRRLGIQVVVYDETGVGRGALDFERLGAEFCTGESLREEDRKLADCLAEKIS